MSRFPVLMAFMLMLLLPAAYGAPEAPCGFYGSVTVNGEPAPAGTTITAYIGDTESVSMLTLLEGGYGSAGNPFISRGGEDGDVVSFCVKTPSMQEPAEAAESAEWEPGAVRELNLSVQALAADPGSATHEEPDEETLVPEQQEILIDLDMNMSQSILLSKAQSANIKLSNNLYLLRVKSLSDFGILMVFDDSEEIIINLHDTKAVDLTGDYVTDVGISLDAVDSGTAHMTFTRLEKNPLGAGTEGISGFVIANPVLGSMMIIVLIALFGGVYYLYRSRGSRQVEEK